MAVLCARMKSPEALLELESAIRRISIDIGLVADRVALALSLLDVSPGELHLTALSAG